MGYKRRKDRFIRDRLRQVSLTTIYVFCAIAIGLYIALVGVQKNIDRIVEDRLQETIKNSQNSRDFGLLFSRLNVFRTTFFGHDSFFEQEGAVLKKSISKLQSSVQGPHLKKLLTQLTQQFDAYLERGQWINTIIAWRSGQDEDIDDLLRMLQELLAGRTIEIALEGGSVDYLEQLVMLISGYRESLLEIAKLNAEEDRSIVLAAKVTDPPPLETELNSLALRLRTLTASEPPIDRFGRHLISRIDYYQYLMRLYQLEMIQLNQQNQRLDQLTQEILGSMEQLDRQTSSAALQTRHEIKKTIYTTVASILGLLVLMATISWISHRTLFKNHIQIPMDLVSRRLAAFQNGDHTTPLTLMRQDEWGEIEAIFNKMLYTLQEHVDALQASEKRYREIFTNATEGIFRSTVSGQFIELNPAAAEMLGFDSTEEAKSYFSDIGHQLYDTPQAREQMLKTLYREGTSLNFETLMRRQNGELFWSVVNNYLIYDEDGHISYIEGTIRDISVRKAAQDSLQQIQDYLQNIIDSMPSVLIGVNSELQVTLWNKRAEQESVLTSDEAKGKPLMQVCRLFQPSAYQQQLEETLATHKPTRLSKISSIKRTADGRNRFFDILIYPLSLSETSGAVIHMDDVSERVRLEDMMVRSEKMRSVGSLASGLAHEINNPLAAILQNVQVLGRRLSPDLAKNSEAAEELGTTIEAIAQYVQVRGCDKMLQSITDAGQRAAEIVANMQSFSRRGVANFSICSITDLFERTLDLASSDYDMRHNYDLRKVQIVRDFKPVPKVSCESSQIQQAILSLLKNAVQVMSTYTDEPKLTIRIFPYGQKHVLLQFKDNGPGMEKDVCDRIFDPFYTTRDVGLGSGLGLSIAYFIVTQNHKGNLSVTSDPGCGSCFDMLLPIEHEDEKFSF